MDDFETGLFDVLVVGCGPAGLAAAAAAAEKGAKTLLLERMERPGMKLLASGGGRCNVGNALPLQAFMARFGRNGRFMSNALESASPEWLRGFLASRGAECALTDGFHYFAKSGRAADILSAFIGECRSLGVEIRTGVRVSSVERLADGAFEIKAGDSSFKSKAVVLATGGAAWSSLGGSRSGLELARSLGHSIVKPLPAMAPIIVSDPWVRQLSGVSLKESLLVLDLGGRKRFTGEGELLFTHDGFSGPVALDLSGDIAAACDEANGPVKFSLQIKPGWGVGEWTSEIDSWRSVEARRLVRTVLGKHVPRSLADALCTIASCPDVACCELKAADRDSLASILASTPITATGAGPMDKAMAMRGGVSLKEVDPRTLQSKIAPGLFLAGELLDLVGPCGGYNIQWAFSSGRLAGLSAFPPGG